MAEIAQLVKEYGGTVVLSVVLLFILRKLWLFTGDITQNHREERKAWQEKDERLTNTQIELQKETNKALTEITKAISESNKKDEN